MENDFMVGGGGIRVYFSPFVNKLFCYDFDVDSDLISSFVQKLFSHNSCWCQCFQISSFVDYSGLAKSSIE
jgi:hypothetical protein